MAGIIGRIYKIVSSECDGCYIGSTTQQLELRLRKHKKSYSRYIKGKGDNVTAYPILKYTDAAIELIHEGIFDGRRDLELMEGEIIRTTPNAVNKTMVGWRGTRQEYGKQYYQDNREAHRTYNTTKHNCSICGGKYTNSSKSTHVKTKKHQDAVSSTSSVIDTSDDDTEDDP